MYDNELEKKLYKNIKIVLYMIKVKN